MEVPPLTRFNTTYIQSPILPPGDRRQRRRGAEQRLGPSSERNGAPRTEDNLKQPGWNYHQTKQLITYEALSFVDGATYPG